MESLGQADEDYKPGGTENDTANPVVIAPTSVLGDIAANDRSDVRTVCYTMEKC